MKKCVISLNKDEKAMPFRNFQMVNVKNLKVEFKKKWKNTTYLFTKILIIGWYTQRYIRELVKKLGQFRERHMTLNCLLTPAHLNSIWKVNSAKVHFYLLTCELKKIQLFVGRLGGKSKNICCIKKKHTIW